METSLGPLFRRSSKLSLPHSSLILLPFSLEQVLSSRFLISGVVEPPSVTLTTMQAISCLLNLTSQPETPPDTVTQVNVTATPASHNADVKEVQLFSLTVTGKRTGLGTGEGLKNENKLAVWKTVWKIFLISASSCVLLILVIALVVLIIRQRSYSSWKPAENRTRNGSRGIRNNEPLQLHNINHGYASDMA